MDAEVIRQGRVESRDDSLEPGEIASMLFPGR